MASSDIVKWSGYDIEDAEHEKQQIDSESGSMFVPEVGINKVRFIPAMPGKKVFRIIHQHYLNVPGETKPVVFACPRMAEKKKCPACDVGFALRSSGNPADRERASDFLPTRRVFSNVIDRKNPEAGPRVYAFGKTVHEALIAIRRDEDAGGDFTHPEQGFDIVIERTGTGKTDTKYMVRASRKVTALGDMEWISMQHDLDRYAQLPSLEEIKEKLVTAKVDVAAAAKDVTPARRASVEDEDDE